MKYQTTPKFDRDFKRPLKRYRTLTEDLETAKRNAIELFHEKEINNLSVFVIPGFSSDQVQVYKLKKFSSKSFKGRGVQSGVRLVYAFYPGQELVVLIEIYLKADQENEDRQRILEYLKLRNNNIN